MKTLKKIEGKGWKVTANIGYKNGEQCISSYTAEKNRQIISRPNITQLYNAVR